jgi:hypothetical protein
MLPQFDRKAFFRSMTFSDLLSPLNKGYLVGTVDGVKRIAFVDLSQRPGVLILLSPKLDFVPLYIRHTGHSDDRFSTKLSK